MNCAPNPPGTPSPACGPDFSSSAAVAPPANSATARHTVARTIIAEPPFVTDPIRSLTTPPGNRELSVGHDTDLPKRTNFSTRKLDLPYKHWYTENNISVGD